MRPVGDWHLGRRLRPGAHGTFYRAVSRRDEAAVLKVAHRRSTDRDHEQMANEIRLLAELAGPGVAELIDAGSHRGRLFYVTPRYVPIDVGTDSGDAALVAAVRAVGRLHAMGVSHRDPRPANLLTDGRSGRLCDLGMAEQSMPERRTRGVGILGDIAYVEPQVIEGVAAAPAGDVWALGIAIHEIYTGVTPFPTTRSWDLAAAVDAVLRGLPRFHPGIPLRLRPVLARCLRRRRHERYPDAATLADELEGATG